MINLYLFVPLLFALQLFYWIVGRRASKDIASQQDYFLAGKSVLFFPLMMTFLATQVGGGVILGAAEEAYLFGWPVFLYPLGQGIGLMILGCGIGKKLASFKVSTISEILEQVYGSSSLKKITSALSILSLYMVLVAQIIASSKFLVSLGMDNTPLFILFWGIIILYTAQGGLRAVISTDMVQAGFFTGIFLLCFAFVFFSPPATPSIDIARIGFGDVSSKLTGWLLMPLLFMLIEQDMGQRCFAAASPRVASKAAFVAGLVSIVVCIVPVYFGSLAREQGFEIPNGGSVLMTSIGNTTTPWIGALAGCAVLAAIVSTATSLINAISSNLSSDFDFAFAKKEKEMRGVRQITSLMAVSAILFAFYFNNVVDLLIQSYELFAAAVFVPVMFALFKRKGNLISAFGAVLFGTIGFVLFRFISIGIPKEIASVLLSLGGYLLGEAFVFISRRQGEAASIR